MKGIVDVFGDDEIQVFVNIFVVMLVFKLVVLLCVVILCSFGEILVVCGVWECNIFECVICYGLVGSGVGEVFLLLQGQGEMYLSNQLCVWQFGICCNDLNDLMGYIVKFFSEEEICSVSQFFVIFGQVGGQL